MADVEIMQIPATLAEVAWPQALPLLTAPIGMSRGCFEPEDVLAICVSGGGQLWLAVDGEEAIAAYVTEIYQYPRKRVVRALFAGGKTGTMQRWLEPMVAAIEHWAREQWGCQGIEAVGRKGWSRMLDGEEVGVYLCRDFPAMEVH
jgi:hypothetical protein